MGRETLRTGVKILTDIAEKRSPKLSPKDIVSKHVFESVQNLIGNLRGVGSNRARGVTSVTKKRNRKNGPVYYKGTSNHLLQSLVIVSGAEFEEVSSEFDIFLQRPIQTTVLGTVESVYKPLA